LFQKAFNSAVERLRQPLFSWRTSLHFCNGKLWILDHAKSVSERVGHRGNANAFIGVGANSVLQGSQSFLSALIAFVSNDKSFLTKFAHRSRIIRSPSRSGCCRCERTGRISISCNLSLTPGFSPVWGQGQAEAVSTALAEARNDLGTSKRLKPFRSARPFITRLKPGVNEKKKFLGKKLSCAVSKQDFHFKSWQAAEHSYREREIFN
jgi:hypothetical protein